MELIAGKLNDSWLESLLKRAGQDCDWVKAAIAYANGSPKLIAFCFENNIPLTFWGRYDSSVPVSVNILKRFLDRKSINQVCKLITESFHPKVIWWGGFGAYVGSANLTENGWVRNIECGLFLSESELIEHGLELELEKFFDELDHFSHPLSQEIIDELERMELENRELRRLQQQLREDFDKRRIIPKMESLVACDKRPSEERLKEEFMNEWYATLELLRNIGKRVSSEQCRPGWVKDDVPEGVQADQFLHAYYYNRVSEGRRSPFRDFYERHKRNPEAALVEAISWWKQLNEPPSGEDRTIYEWSPFLRHHLSKENLLALTLDQFKEVCRRVHAMRDHAIRVDNQTFGLPKDTPKKERDECIELLATYLWSQRSERGKTVLDTIHFVFFGGPGQDLPRRLWEATHSTVWRIPHLGISSLGELVGWAMPDLFPPRNGRTSKALMALGNKVTIHTE